mmetsp:Transcript_27344/g.42254  ORF Transcript_27344/g.42254 Transcript_27344/m.42254 type:complete len:114 (-) Transcript_27344:190-531(-)
MTCIGSRGMHASEISYLMITFIENIDDASLTRADRKELYNYCAIQIIWLLIILPHPPPQIKKNAAAYVSQNINECKITIFRYLTTAFPFSKHRIFGNGNILAVRIPRTERNGT